MKTITISGVYGDRTDAKVTFNGSANWSGLTLRSDEVIGRVFSARVTEKYAARADRLFQRPPPRGVAHDGADRRWMERGDLTRRERRLHGMEL